MSAETIAERLRALHPDVEPLELDGDAVAELMTGAGVDPDDDALVARALVAWERLLR